MTKSIRAMGAKLDRMRDMKRIREQKFDEQKNIVSAKIDINEYTCRYCNFKARYKFFRCPDCDKKQEL